MAAIGLAGLVQRGLWQRRALTVSVLVGLAVLTAGTGGWAGSVFSGVWLDALDTSLAPLRNIHKFDPVVRLPLSLGVGAWVTTGLPRVVEPLVRLVDDPGAPTVHRRLRAAGGADVPSPQPVGRCGSTTGSRTCRRDGARRSPTCASSPRRPASWCCRAPGSPSRTWGRTIDEPIQVLDPPPWLARAQVTVAPAGTLRLLDTLEQSVGEARPQGRVEETLRELGVTHVVVRNDLDLEETDAPDPDVVRATVGRIPGSRIAASFGDGPDGGPAVVVYALDSDDDSRVDVQDWEGRAVVDGGPEVVPDLRAAGLVGAHQAVVLATEGERPDLVTDSLRRVERSFGRVHDAQSGVMTADDDYRVSRQAHDYSDSSMPTRRTTAVYDGAADIVASSSAGYADVLGPVRPEQHPYSAFDHSIYTAWVSAPLSRPSGQWVEARFEEPVAITTVSLSFDTFSGAHVTSVRVETEDHSVVADVEPDGTVPDLVLDDASATRAADHRAGCRRWRGAGPALGRPDRRPRHHPVLRRAGAGGGRHQRLPLQRGPAAGLRGPGGRRRRHLRAQQAA